jgi:hypothetical protein
MRMSLLLGGDNVRRAEREAVDFYEGKAGFVDERLDGNSVELAEKRAQYDLALDRTFNATDEATRIAAMKEADALSREIAALDGERQRLEGRRANLEKLISSVEQRDRDRQRLVAELETADDLGSGGLGLFYPSIGLAPTVAEESSPLENSGLIEDMLQRNPVEARRILFDSDPQAYWQRFPLRPPTQPLRQALAFPVPDLPGDR